MPQSNASPDAGFSRRHWLATTGAACAGTLLSRISRGDEADRARTQQSQQSQQSAGEAPSRKFIDCHLHINHFDRSIEDSIRHMDATGVEKAFVLPLETGEGGVLLRSETVLHAFHRYPERIIPFCQTDIRQPDALERIKAYHLLGCRGIGEQKEHLPLNDKRVEAVIALCDELDWPITIHFQDSRNGYNQGLAEHLETYLKRYRKVRILAHAQTWWANISAEVPPPEETLYPKGPVKRGGLIEKLLGEYPNLYADMSAGSGYNALTRDPDYTAELIEKTPGQFLFGSDCPCTDGAGENFRAGLCYATQLRAFLEQIITSEDVMEDVCYNNHLRALNGAAAPASGG